MTGREGDNGDRGGDSGRPPGVRSHPHTVRLPQVEDRAGDRGLAVEDQPGVPAELPRSPPLLQQTVARQPHIRYRLGHNTHTGIGCCPECSAAAPQCAMFTILTAGQCLAEEAGQVLGGPGGGPGGGLLGGGGGGLLGGGGLRRRWRDALSLAVTPLFIMSHIQGEQTGGGDHSVQETAQRDRAGSGFLFALLPG